MTNKLVKQVNEATKAFYYSKPIYNQGDLDILLAEYRKTILVEVASIKRWLKGRNIPTETKDELRRRLNKIGG